MIKFRAKLEKALGPTLMPGKRALPPAMSRVSLLSPGLCPRVSPAPKGDSHPWGGSFAPCSRRDGLS